MSTKAAKASEFPVTLWETFEGVTYGYDDMGSTRVEVSARVLLSESVAEHESNVRGWAAWDEHRNLTTGHVEGLRLAKKAALAALRAS